MPAKKKNELTMAIQKLRAKVPDKSEDQIQEWESAGDAIISQGIKRFKAKLPPQPPKQLVMSFMPNAVARCSPFFPMSRQQMKDRPFETLEFDTPWGNIKIEGRKLSVHDETVLLAILSVVRKECQETVKITPYRICKLMNVTRQPGVYKAIKASLKRMTGTYIEIQTKGKTKKELFGTILSGGVDSPDVPGSGFVTVNPYFLETLAGGFLSIDVKFRATLKGDVTKTLYRFVLSQDPNPYSCHVLKMARAINLNENLPLSKIRYQLRAALKELRAKGFLTRYKINKRDIVTLYKSQKPVRKI